jgi:hypothetical protein
MAPKARKGVITLKERFDPGALSYIIVNFASFRFRPETDTASTFETLRRYKAAAATDGTLDVSYNRLAHGHGRLFADHGVSMQGMPREIRNAIAFRIHHDLDFQNCHPSLLLQFCRRNEVPCPRLAEYVADRPSILAALQDGASVPGAAKTAVLAVIYGGAVESPLRGVDPLNRGVPWLRAFGDEMGAVRKAVLELPSGAPYLALAAKSAAKKAAAGTDKKTPNLYGSAMNHLVCDLENDALMALRHFIEVVKGRKVGVLIFDGLTVERTGEGELPSELLDAASDHVFCATGYRLRIAEKDMAADKLDVPREAYTVWDACEMTAAASGTNEDGGVDGMHADLVAGLRGIGGPLGGLPESCSFSKVKDGLRFMVDEQSEALMHRDSTRIFTTDPADPAYLGAYCGEFTTDVSFGNLHKDIPPDVDKYRCTVHEKVTVLDADGGKVRLSLYNSQTPENARIELAVRGKSDSSITAPAKIRSLMTTLAANVDKELRRRLGPDSLQLFSLVNNGTININILDPDANRHTDEQLVKAVIAANPELLVRHRFVPDVKAGSCNGLYVCDRDTNVWAQRHNVEVEGTLVCMFAAMELTDADRRHVESRRGGNDMIYKLAGKVVDNSFLAKLDANPDIFAVANGLFDWSTGEFRPITPEDAVLTTTGWAYDAELAAAHRPDFEAFLQEVLPVAEEREVVLVFFARLLSGRRKEKKFMLMTDRRAGNNGKSALLKLLERFFGGYAMKSVKFMCRGAFEQDRNSHDAGYQPLCGKRFLLADELKSSMTLDDALVKRVAGGPQEYVTGRLINSGDRFCFLWQAGIVLAFNEHDCPKFDAADAALLARMLVVPMRSKFVTDRSQVNREELTFLMDADMLQRSAAWMPAILDVLRERIDMLAVLYNPPASMIEWKQELSNGANSLADWLSARVTVTGNRSDFLLLGRLLEVFRDDRSADKPTHVAPAKFVGLAKAYFAACEGATFPPTNVYSVKINGRFVSQRNVVIGAVVNA